MCKTQAPLNRNDFCHSEFPELTQHIDDVLIELNGVLSESLEELRAELGSEIKSHCHQIDALRDDILTSPYLYISDRLMQQIRSC